MAAPMPGSGRTPLPANRDSMNSANIGRRDLLEPHHGAGLVERPARANHLVHQARLGAGEHVPTFRCCCAAARSACSTDPPLNPSIAWNSSSATTTVRFRSAASRPGSAKISLASRFTSRSVLTAGNATANRRSGSAGLESQLGSRGRDGLGQPRSRALPSRLHRRQRPRVSLEERDVGAVAADRQVNRQRALP